MGSNYTPYDNLGEVSATNTTKKVPNANHGYKYVCIAIPKRLTDLTQIINHCHTGTGSKYERKNNKTKICLYQRM